LAFNYAFSFLCLEIQIKVKNKTIFKVILTSIIVETDGVITDLKNYLLFYIN